MTEKCFGSHESNLKTFSYLKDTFSPKKSLLLSHVLLKQTHQTDYDSVCRMSFSMQLRRTNSHELSTYYKITFTQNPSLVVHIVLILYTCPRSLRRPDGCEEGGNRAKKHRKTGSE